MYPPWKPKFGDIYYYNNRFGELHRGIAGANNLFDLMITKLGKAYRTEEEAKSHAEEDAAFWESIRKELLKGAVAFFATVREGESNDKV